MLKEATVFLVDSQPLQVQEIEEEPSQSVTTFSGKRLHLRRALTAGGVEDWIPEEMIISVEE